MARKAGTIVKAIGVDQSMVMATRMVTTKHGRTMTTMAKAAGMEKASTVMASTMMTSDD
jgi:hypothetical protein